MHRGVCVFCSSSDAVDARYFAAAEALGKLLADRDFPLVYGGTKVGLMGALARSVLAHHGAVFGVLPKRLHAKGIGLDEGSGEILLTEDMRQRKAVMEERAGGFIAMPGGFGTLEEVLEILTLRQLGFHQKPVVFLDIDGFWRPLMDLFEHVYRERFAKPSFRRHYHLAPTPAEAVAYLEDYEPDAVEEKWF